jgi:hypothetical protein
MDSNAIKFELFFITTKLSHTQRSFKYLKGKDKVFHAHNMKAHKETGDRTAQILTRSNT